MITRIQLSLLLALNLIFVVSYGHATEPCQPSPCRDATYKFQSEECLNAASWVVVGTIVDVTHNVMGAPLQRDFADFTFVVARTEKGTAPSQRMKFQVGWCDNPPIPSDSLGEFRMYGTDGVHAERKDSGQYLEIEKLSQ